MINFSLRKIICFALFLFIASCVFAVDVRFDNLDSSSIRIPDEILEAFRDSVVEKFSKFENGEKFIHGMEESSSLAAGNGFMHIGKGSDFATVSLSASAGIGIDEKIDSLNKEYFENLLKDYVDNGDKYMGVSTFPLTANIGFNLSKLLGLKNSSHLSLRAGKLIFDYEDFNLDYTILGVKADYRFWDRDDDRIIKWNGLTLGAGLTWYDFNAGYIVKDVTEISSGGNILGKPATLTLSPDLDIKADISHYVADATVYTGVKLALLHINAGIGADLIFGGDNMITAKSFSDVVFKYDGDEKPIAKANVKLNVNDSFNTVRFKYAVSLGFSLGPIRIEIPYSQYFDDELCSSLSVLLGVAF